MIAANLSQLPIILRAVRGRARTRGPPGSLRSRDLVARVVNLTVTYGASSRSSVLCSSLSSCTVDCSSATGSDVGFGSSRA